MLHEMVISQLRHSFLLAACVHFVHHEMTTSYRAGAQPWHPLFRPCASS